jgi:MinD superfamily P-loop ATPase
VKEVVVLSGKGGTGKTSIVGCFAALASSKVLADCDVDAADLHLLLKPSVKEKKEFWSGQTALIIDEKLCSQCGMCETVCRFNAIKDFVVSPLTCEGCAFCTYVCPEHCIAMKERMAGHWFVSDTRHGPLVHAQLGIAEENSGKLVTVVRNYARILAKRENLSHIIIDGPPGLGCPVISSLSGVNLALLVTEPTLSGMHDLERVIGLCQHFHVPAMVCINKYDVNEENSRRIVEQCKTQGIEVAAQIPFDTSVTEALIRGLSVVEYSHNGVAKQIEALWESVLKRLEERA